MRQAIIKDGLVVNICVGDAGGITIPDNSPIAIGWSYNAGLFAARVTHVPALAEAKTTALTAIDAQAGATRLKYITDVTGQAETYLAKASDAAAYKAALYPVANIASYSMVQAEAKALYGDTPTAVQYQLAADGIIITQLQWITLAAAIEQQRRGGKIAVNAATTNAGAEAAQFAAIAALKAL